ncbi:zf-HC2 domain-containing protein [Nonomuraea sp. NPDC049709]|uniref:anti-sigma factor family protein n=1 Tax=Nonomuraea sp. NPDC049709 TaxID=3154736 RepID=UPI00343C4795
MTCEEVRIALGAHALGALDPQEALEIDHHLATCEACGAELLELEGVTSFLGKVSERDVELVASPPRQVLDRLLNDRVRRNRRGRILMAVAASAAVLVVGGTVWTAIQTRSANESSAAAPAAARSAGSAESDTRAQQDQSSAQLAQPLRSTAPSRKVAPSQSPSQSPARSPAPETQADLPSSEQPLKAAEGREFTGANKAADYRATVLAWPTDAGTELGVRVSGVPVDTTCSLVVVGVDGSREPTESWVVSREGYQDRAVFRRETTKTMREIARFEIVDGAGKVLVEVPLRKQPRK